MPDTNNFHFNVRLDCWPVGQGLFMSGALTIPDKNHTFHWVYDCGSSCASHSVSVSTCISLYNNQVNSSKTIDLLTISHFDRDHINGIAELCKGKTIEILLLPYLSLYIRLYLAIAELEQAGQEITPGAVLQNMHYDPLRIFSDSDITVKEILFVPGNQDPLPFPDRVPEGDKPAYDAGDLTDEEKSDFRTLAAGVRYKKLTSAILLGHYWEFTPYNDINPLDDAIKAGKNLDAIKTAANVFHNSKTQKALDALKQEYDNVFGSKSKPRNIISLFLYCAPVNENKDEDKAYAHKAFSIENYYGKFARKIRKNFHWLESRRNAQFYTGDGYLANAEQWNKLRIFYGQQRIGKISFLQVMHHGSRNNWHLGLADEFQPQISMFSSDPDYNPKKYGHPHKEVKTDFTLYNPVQVGGIDGCHLTVRWSFCSNLQYHMAQGHTCCFVFLYAHQNLTCPICKEAW